MKKTLLKKSVRKRIKSWEIGDYIRQFSIVTGGVLLTLWLTARITESSKQREVRQALQLVTLELQDNLQVIREYEWLYNEEKRVAHRLQKADFSLSAFPIDTVEVYYRRIMNGMGKPYRLLTDGWDMLKITGRASEIDNDQLVYGLSRTYNDIYAFDEKMSIFYRRRGEMLTAYQLGAKHYSHDIGIRENFTEILTDKTIQGWITAVPNAFEKDFFEQFANELELLITILEKTYS